MTFSGDLKCNEANDAPDDEHWFTGDYVWVKKPFTFCAPLGLADIFYVRAEARRADEGSGLGQINFAQICKQGSSAGGPAIVLLLILAILIAQSRRNCEVPGSS